MYIFINVYRGVLGLGGVGVSRTPFSPPSFVYKCTQYCTINCNGGSVSGAVSLALYSFVHVCTRECIAKLHNSSFLDKIEPNNYSVCFN
jgi:hypothetical protein